MPRAVVFAIFAFVLAACTTLESTHYSSTRTFVDDEVDIIPDIPEYGSVYDGNVASGVDSRIARPQPSSKQSLFAQNKKEPVAKPKAQADSSFTSFTRSNEFVTQPLSPFDDEFVVTPPPPPKPKPTTQSSTVKRTGTSTAAKTGASSAVKKPVSSSGVKSSSTVKRPVSKTGVSSAKKRTTSSSKPAVKKPTPTPPKPAATSTTTTPPSPPPPPPAPPAPQPDTTPSTPPVSNLRLSNQR